ncbi:MAG: nucleoside deaminase [Patescibacteria group bacterium]|nr:nucleoside deaminase [Patescibacteria group bacterium]
MNDKEFLKLAIKQSELSAKQGRFPAGALIVFRDEIVASETSDIYPGYQHAECRAIDDAFQKIGKLTDATLYTSLEPCLMCLTRAYWSGIRRIVFAISKKKVDKQDYEGQQDNREIVKRLNEPIEYLQIIDMENEALKVLRTR